MNDTCYLQSWWRQKKRCHSTATVHFICLQSVKRNDIFYSELVRTKEKMLQYTSGTLLFVQSVKGMTPFIHRVGEDERKDVTIHQQRLHSWPADTRTTGAGDGPPGGAQSQRLPAGSAACASRGIGERYFQTTEGGGELTDWPRKVRQGSHSLWRSLKVWGKWDDLFKALKVCENWVGSVKVCEFVVFIVLGKNCQLISQKLHFPRTNSSLLFIF